METCDGHVINMLQIYIYTRTSNVTLHTSHDTRHTSHVTRHTSHVTRHTSNVTRHTSNVTRYPSVTLCLSIAVAGWVTLAFQIKIQVSVVWCSWFVVCGLWFVVCGLWFTVCGLRFVFISFSFRLFCAKIRPESPSQLFRRLLIRQCSDRTFIRFYVCAICCLHIFRAIFAMIS